MISVIMSVYNEEVEEFMQALRSMQEQTYNEIEILVIVDNPKRKDIIFALSQQNDTRVQYFINQKNIGLALSMNFAAKKARGEYLARMDADDISAPERLEKELLLIERSNADYVCSWCDMINENGDRLQNLWEMFPNKILNEMLPYRSTIPHSSVLIKKNVFESVGGYRNFPCAQDYDLWLRLYDKGFRVAVVEEVLVSYRIRPDSITSKKGLQQFYTTEYIKRLSRERRKKGYDSYNDLNYQTYLNQKKTFNLDRISEFQQIRRKRIENGRLSYLGSIIKSDIVRKMIWNGIEYRFMKYMIYIVKFKT